MFFLVGLAIRLGELADAALNLRLNLLTQVFSLGAMPTLGWLLSRALLVGGIHPSLADGVMILVRTRCALFTRQMYMGSCKIEGPSAAI